MSDQEVKNLELLFQARIDNDEKIEPKDWMPESIARHTFVKFHNTHIPKLLECCPKEIGLRVRLL